MLQYTVSQYIGLCHILEGTTVLLHLKKKKDFDAILFTVYKNVTSLLIKKKTNKMADLYK